MESADIKLTDRELVDLAQRGDRSAFEALIRRYQAKILSLCSRLIGRSEEARELAADVFAEAFQSLPRFRKESKFSTWLYQIASNRSFSRLREIVRDRKRFVVQETDSDERAGFSSIQPGGSAANFGGKPAPADHPIHQLEQEETKSRIRLVLARLGKDQAQILLLHDLEELSYAEISEILGCPIGTVMSRLSRARQAFRKKWNQLDKEQQVPTLK
jgi:RNA polymerase sigma-70 factor (ECF subfamily)